MNNNPTFKHLVLIAALPALILLPYFCRGLADENILFKKYSEQVSFLDSLREKIEQHDYPNPVEELEQSENWAKEKGDEQLHLALRVLHFRYLLQAEKYDTDFENHVLEIAEQAENISPQFVKADALELIADYFWEVKKFSRAFEYYIYAYDIYSKFSADDFPNKPKHMYDFGGRYYYFTDYETAKHYFLEIWNTVPHEKLTIIFPVLNNIALSYSYLQQYDSSEYYFRTGIELATRSNNQTWIGILTGNIANIFYLKSKYDEAIPLFEKDIALSLQGNQMMNAAYSMSRLGDIYLRKNENKKGLALELQAYEILRQKNKQRDYRAVKTVYPVIAKAYAANGNMNLAYAFLDTGTVAKDSVTEQRNILYLSGAQHKIEATKHLVEMQKKEAELSRQKLVRNGSVAGLVLVLMLLLFVYHSYTNQREANRKLKEAQEQLVRSEKMAAFGALASHVAHEIQNPLNFVNNFSEISEELVAEILTTTDADTRTETGAVLQENLKHIVHHGKRVADIVKKLQMPQSSSQVFFGEKK